MKGGRGGSSDDSPGWLLPRASDTTVQITLHLSSTGVKHKGIISILSHCCDWIFFRFLVVLVVHVHHLCSVKSKGKPVRRNAKLGLVWKTYQPNNLPWLMILMSFWSVILSVSAIGRRWLSVLARSQPYHTPRLIRCSWFDQISSWVWFMIFKGQPFNKKLLVSWHFGDIFRISILHVQPEHVEASWCCCCRAAGPCWAGCPVGPPGKTWIWRSMMGTAKTELYSLWKIVDSSMTLFQNPNISLNISIVKIKIL